MGPSFMNRGDVNNFKCAMNLILICGCDIQTWAGKILFDVLLLSLFNEIMNFSGFKLFFFFFFSILGRIVRVTDRVILYRNWVSENFHDSTLSTSPSTSEGSISSSDSVSSIAINLNLWFLHYIFFHRKMDYIYFIIFLRSVRYWILDRLEKLK